MMSHAALESLVVRSLSHSLPVDLMIKIAKKIIPDYDIHERSGFPPSISIPRVDAARQIFGDIQRAGSLLKLAETLIDMHYNGHMGRPVRVQFLDRIIAEVEAQGYRYSTADRVFVEAASREKTMGWGTLQEDGTYEFALLRADIVGNAKLVRMYDRDDVNTAFDKTRELVRNAVEKRNGRIWSWEGDGGLAAFYFVDKNIQATLCGMEIIHELFLFNLLQSPLPESLAVRLAVHAGPCKFLSSGKDIASETIRRVEEIESKFTKPDSLTVSPGIYTDLGGKLSQFFTQVPGPENSPLYRYILRWEKR
jgi:class 3 adenylate cyclase